MQPLGWFRPAGSALALPEIQTRPSSRWRGVGASDAIRLLAKWTLSRIERRMVATAWRWNEDLVVQKKSCKGDLVA